MSKGRPGTRWLPHAAIASFAVFVTWPCATLDAPVNYDHSVHLAKSGLAFSQMARFAWPFGWTQSWFSGYPLDLHYGAGADAFVALLRFGSLGLLGATEAYALALLLTFTLYGLAVYSVGRLFLGRPTATAAALLALADRGTWFLGGYTWVMDVGVWPSLLCLSLILLALREWVLIGRGAGPRHAAAFGVLAGLAGFTHPVSALLFPVALPLVCLAAWLGGEEAPSRRILAARGAGLAVALAIAGAWWIPDTLTRDFRLPLPLHWTSLDEVAHRWAGLSLLEHSAIVPAALALVGVLCLAAAGRGVGAAFGWIPLVLVVTATNDVVDGIVRPLFPPAVAQVEFPRLVFLAKPFFFLAGAWLLEQGVRRLTARTASRRVGAGALTLAIAAAVAVVTACNFHTISRSNSPYRETLALFERWLLSLEPDPLTPYRVAYRADLPSPHNLVAYSFAGRVPLLKTGPTPSASFLYMRDDGSEETWRRLGVRYVVFDRPVSRPALRHTADLGVLSVYEREGWRTSPFRVVEGAGTVALEKWSDEEIVARAAPGASGVLELAVTWFPFWSASRDGQPVPLTPSAGKPPDGHFMRVPLGPGVYRFTYRRDLPTRLAGLVALTTLLAAGLYWARCAMMKE